MSRKSIPLGKTVGNNKDISHCIIVNQKRFSLGFFQTNNVRDQNVIFKDKIVGIFWHFFSILILPHNILVMINYTT